jgi:hypothetical protein
LEERVYENGFKPTRELFSIWMLSVLHNTVCLIAGIAAQHGHWYCIVHNHRPWWLPTAGSEAFDWMTAMGGASTS